MNERTGSRRSCDIPPLPVLTPYGLHLVFFLFRFVSVPHHVVRTSTVEWPYVSADLELLSVRIVALRLLLHFQVFCLEPLPPPYLIILLSVCAIGRLCAASGWNQNHVKCLDVAMFFFFWGRGPN